MVFALNYINEKVKNGSRQVALDAEIRDTCSNGISSTDTVLNLIREAEQDRTTIAGDIYAYLQFGS